MAFRSEIDHIGKVLQLLGLAKKSDECDLGWLPNLRLMRLIGDQLYPSENGKFVVKEHDREFVAQIFHLATGNDLDLNNNDFCCELLAIIGLLKKGRKGVFKPTVRMKALVLERFAELAPKKEKEEDKENKN